MKAKIVVMWAQEWGFVDRYWCTFASTVIALYIGIPFEDYKGGVTYL
jgi:hypothetical protein